MRKYETIVISDPDLQDQTRKELFEKVSNIITRENGILLDLDEWGNKKLAYEIKKKVRGYYICLTYGGDGDLVKELERNMRLSDGILKYMTVLLSDSETAESLAKEAADAAEAVEAAEAAKAPKPTEEAAETKSADDAVETVEEKVAEPVAEPVEEATDAKDAQE